MPGENLTRTEARERARLLQVESYDVALDLTTGNETFRSETLVRFRCADPGASTFIDLIAPKLRAAELNGVTLDPVDVFDGTRIALPPLAAENVLRVVADCAYSRTGEGLHRFVDPVDDRVYLYTQFEVPDARRVYANFEQPDLKASFTFRVTAPAHWEVVSNSPTPVPQLVRAPVGGDPGVSLWTFEPTPRISSYITALVAGDYHVVRDAYVRQGGGTGGQVSIPLGVFCRKSLAAHLDAADIFTATKQGFDHYLDLFDVPYPFAKYDQLFVPEFNAGAMENAGCVTILEDYVFRSKVTDAAYEARGETLLHELAHMWFGDLVTMEWWDDLWLNESFATYASFLCQAEATRWSHAWTTFAGSMKAWAARQDQLPSTHPIVADINDLQDVQVNFDGITYAKGASVLKQLVAWVGRDAFFAGVRRYFARHAWGNTTLADLLSALEETSGRDLKAWSRSWLETAGINTLRPEYAVDADGRFTSFTVVQEAPEHLPTLRPHRVAVGLYRRGDSRLARVRRVELDVDGERTAVDELVGELRPDLVLLNDDDLAYTKIRLDEHSLRTLTSAIGEIGESLPRALCWSAAWDMTRDAEMAARDYLDLVVSGIGRESDIGVVQGLQRQVTSALQLYAAPEWREEGLRRWAEAARRHLAAATPGSGHQLSWARTVAGVARTDEQLGFIAGLLSGAEKVDGLTIDTDLRWALLHRLAATGRAGEDEIAAELVRDQTATGERHAASCRAARPTAEAKRDAWEQVVVTGGLPNAIQAAVIGGFVQADQRELMASYVAPYFERLEDVWENRSNEIAQQIVVRLYPAVVADPATTAATDAWLADHPEAPAALRRLVLEGRDGVERALRAQARDAAAAAH